MNRTQSGPRPRIARVFGAACLALILAIALAAVNATPGRSSAVGSASAPATVTIARAESRSAPLASTSQASHTTATAGQQVPDSANTAVAGQQVHIDPRTGALREAEHDDAVALRAAKNQKRTLRTFGAESADAPQALFGPDGAVGMTLPEELETSMVATRLPDGRVVFSHATGLKHARAKVPAGATQTRKVPAKEDRNDRHGRAEQNCCPALRPAMTQSVLYCGHEKQNQHHWSACEPGPCEPPPVSCLSWSGSTSH